MVWNKTIEWITSNNYVADLSRCQYGLALPFLWMDARLSIRRHLLLFSFAFAAVQIKNIRSPLWISDV